MSTYHQLDYKSQAWLWSICPSPLSAGPVLLLMEPSLSFPAGPREDVPVSGPELGEVFLNWE